VPYPVSPNLLHAVYVAYAVAIAVMVWNYAPAVYTPIVAQVSDIVICVVFQYLSLGVTSSPFFTYMVFSLFCGAMRWGWRGTLWTSFVVLVLFLVMGVIGHYGFPTQQRFDVGRYMSRTFYITVVACLLLSLGQHEVRLRGEIERLTRWPAGSGDQRTVIGSVLQHAADIIGARRVVVAWEDGDEPWLHVAGWTAGSLTIARHRSGDIDPLVPAPLADVTVLSLSADAGSHTLFRDGTDGHETWHGQAVHPSLAGQLSGVGLVSAPLAVDRIVGRVFFSDLNALTTELTTLAVIVAREIATSLTQLSVAEQLRELAASEQRLRVARDLHDGVLQSLTGIRLELQNVAAASDADQRDRLLAIERTLALEQRELRMFINRLRPHDTMLVEHSLLKDLDALRERVALEWNVPLTIRVRPNVRALPSAVEQAVPPMVHEAIVNALKHGAPSRVWVDVGLEDDILRVTINDDGHGFPFRGRYGHAALAEAHLGPASLRDRAASLGGELTIESEAAGSKVEIALPVVIAGVA
jgi:signal transduction histidine kinase